MKSFIANFICKLREIFSNNCGSNDMSPVDKTLNHFFTTKKQVSIDNITFNLTSIYEGEKDLDKTFESLAIKKAADSASDRKIV